MAHEVMSVKMEGFVIRKDKLVQAESVMRRFLTENNLSEEEMDLIGMLEEASFDVTAMDSGDIWVLYYVGEKWGPDMDYLLIDLAPCVHESGRVLVTDGDGEMWGYHVAGGKVYMMEPDINWRVERELVKEW